MAHPHGGEDSFAPENRFGKAYRLAGGNGFRFAAEGSGEITIYQGKARDGVTPTIVFRGPDVRHGSVCEACWGYRVDCNRSPIGKLAESLDAELSRYPG